MSVYQTEKGYFATLGVTFRSDEAAIAKTYKKLAIKMHPDKNPSPTAVDDFQKITTSCAHALVTRCCSSPSHTVLALLHCHGPQQDKSIHEVCDAHVHAPHVTDHVIMDEQKRRNYLRLFMLRCYMSQEVPRGGLRPHYAFMVEKSKHRMGSKSDRLLTIDLLELKLQSYKKDSLKKEFHLSNLAGVQTSDKALELTINFKETHPYFIRCRCQEQFDTLVAVLQRIATAPGLDDESLQLLCDDSDSPPSSVHKSKVIKRAERSLGSSLVAEWQPRFMVMGATQLIIFRDVDLQQLVNVIPLSVLSCVPDGRDRTCFQLATAYWKASFRVLTEEVAARWKSALLEQVAAMKVEPAAGGGVRATANGYRPSVIFTEADLSKVAAVVMPSTPVGRGQPLPTSRAAMDDAGMPPLPALPAPELAAWEGEYADGWVQYRDDLGRPYYFNMHTHETSWTLPKAASRLADADEGPPELKLPTVDSDAERQSQMAALRDDEHGVTSELAFSEAKTSLVALMASMERGLLKARRGVEADRPMQDLAPMFEKLRQTFARVNEVGQEFERSAVQRAQTQATFMQSKNDYLSGLQAHVLGDEGDSTMAGKIFRKGAYVADTFNKMTNMRGVL